MNCAMKRYDGCHFRGPPSRQMATLTTVTGTVIGVKSNRAVILGFVAWCLHQFSLQTVTEGSESITHETRQGVRVLYGIKVAAPD
jgi:hypothetical protein